MKSRLGKRWMAAGVIWVIVIAMTGWNIHLIHQIQYRRQELDTIQMDQRFLQVNTDGIQQIVAQKTRLAHGVKSVGLGFVVVEDNLKQLSWDFGLQKMQVEAEKDVANSRPVRIHIMTTGPVPAIVGWLTAVEEAYPYLIIDQMTVSYDDRTRMGQLQATFNYRYTISQQEGTG